MKKNNIEPKVLLLQMWFGPIPEYFKYHLATTRDLEGFDFLIITDDLSFQVDAQNYRVVNFTAEDFVIRFFQKTGRAAGLRFQKKASDFKICLADIFSEYCEGYTHVGFYDIDTLFSKMNRVREELVNDWDFITLADEIYADRLNGPLVIFKNEPNLVKAYQTEKCYFDLENSDKTDCDEKSYSDHIIQNYRVKKIWACRNLDPKTHGLIEYHCKWQNGNLTSMGRDLEQYHFYNKDTTKFVQLDDNTILAAYNKTLVKDFYWVTCFTENYTSIGENMLRSIVRHSNRPCLVYTVNFDWAIPDDLLASEQFLVRRFDLTKDKMNRLDRNSYMNAKPLYLIDAIDFLPDAKFIYVDADSSITASADQLRDKFSDLDNYPLINSHTHDDILVRVNGEWINSLQILLSQMNVERTAYPRRKCNLMLFDSRSLWFFKEQIGLFDEHIDSQPNIFALHDEDSANAILSKYRLTKGLPVIDIEEVWDLDLSKYSSYSYSVSENSKNSILPTGPNQVAIFHQLKSQEAFDQINNYYGKSVICQDEIIIKYENSSFIWQRNVPEVKSKIPELLDFIIYGETGNQIFKLENQRFRDYWVFCVWNLPLNPGLYPTQIVDSNSGRILYSEILQIKG